jgi:serine/threonine protein kinase
MDFQPIRYERRLLPELLAELVRADSSGNLKEWEHRTEWPLGRRILGATEPSTVDFDPQSLLSTTEDAFLPPGHPTVEIPDVALERYLAGGRQGWVYAGRVRATGVIVAVKILRGDYVQTAGRAAREAMILAKFAHRAILRVFQFEPVGTFWVVIMELVQGDDLAHCGLPGHQIKPCFGLLADALLALAKAGVVHRDVKPANIIPRRKDHSPVLVDFSMAVDITNPLWKPDEFIAGTPRYMAPEVFSGARPEPSWDAYSLGMTAIAVLLGQTYWSNQNLMELVKAKQSGEFDRAVEESLPRIEDVAVREWCSVLVGRNTARRLSALEAARAWLAEGDRV